MRNIVRTIGIALLAVVLSGLLVAPTLAAEKQVWAYYFGWYTGDSWGDGRLVDRPANPYDSRDAGAVGGQIDQAKSAGIDAFIMSWYGPKNDNLTNQVFNMLLDQAGSKGFRAAVSLDLADPGYNSSVDEVIQSLSYVINDRANHGAYLRYEGKPVIYFWNQGRYSVGDWQNIRAQVDPNHNTIWVAEGTNTRFLPTFDGLYLFNTAWSRNPASTARQWLNNTLNAGGTFYSPTVLPGWDESRIEGRDNPTSPQDRGGTAFLTNSWNGAASLGAGPILIVSWNEYLENSHVEPSQNFGAAALDTLRPLIAAWKSGGGDPAAVAVPELVAGPATGVTFTVANNLRLRSAPSTEGEVLGTIPFETIVDVVGRNGDSSWIQVNFNGGSGWVSAQYGTLSADINSLPVTG
jgi:hypothetical protein